MELDFRKDPALLSTIIDEMPIGVFTVDSTGRVVSWSQGAHRITGYPAHQVVGQFSSLFEGPNCTAFAAITDLLSGSCGADTATCHQDCRLLTRDGREIHIHGQLRLLSNPDGSPAGAVATFSDLTPYLAATQRIALLEEHHLSRNALDQLVGSSPAMQEVFRRIRLAAHSDVTVFLTGESGTGKELAARAIHALSSRKNHRFLATNCSALPESLLETELFGHAQGAFTGASHDRVGLFQFAHRGTLLLDEVGDLAPILQLKLLRVLQEREITRVGESRPIPVDVRLITATHRDLKQLVATGALREDFFYRIHVFTIHLPPLRDRPDDIPLLIRLMLAELSQATGKTVHAIARNALDQLLAHPWPGNVRELRNAIEAAFVTVKGDTIELLDLPPEVRHAPRPPDAPRIPTPTPASTAERHRVLTALEQAGGNKTQAAHLLGISRVALWKKLKKLGLHDSPNTP